MCFLHSGVQGIRCGHQDQSSSALAVRGLGLSSRPFVPKRPRLTSRWLKTALFPAMPAGGACLASAQNSAIVRQGRMTLPAKSDEVDHPARMSESLSLSGGCNIREMPRKVPVKCAIADCHRRLKMTLGEREELRRVGRENSATAGIVCPAHVKAAFNFEFDDIDIDVPLEELLVEASKETPRWRVMLTPLLPGATGETDIQPTPGCGDRVM